MPGVARKTDICTGHPGCWTPRPTAGWSSDVYANSLNVHRKGDLWVIHCGHISVLKSGSPNVYANGKQVGRCGDPVVCGSFVATCSSDVIVN